MDFDFGKAIGDLTKSLGRHGPDPLLAFALFVALLLGLQLEYNPWVLLGGLVILWGGYHLRRTATERHKERIAEQEIIRIEATKGRAIKERYRQRISRPTGPLPKPTRDRRQ